MEKGWDMACALDPEGRPTIRLWEHTSSLRICCDAQLHPPTAAFCTGDARRRLRSEGGAAEAP